MKDLLVQRARGKRDALHIARDYLQREILAAIYGPSAPPSDWSFCGGTCLRLLYELPRYSEDLDFCSDSGIATEAMAQAVAVRLRRGGFDVEVVTKKRQGNVWCAEARVSGILHELKLSPMLSQKLTIKIEVDLRPPAGATLDQKTFAAPVPMAVASFDLPSLMAGKLHAILARKYEKGRDWYDLVWYLGKGVDPNLALLDAALVQQPSEFCDNAEHWKQGVLDRMKSLRWDAVRRDVAPFLQHSNEIEWLTPRSIEIALGHLPSSTPPRLKHHRRQGSLP